MPLSKDMTISEMISELMSAYKETGLIGGIKPRDKEHALEIATAIAHRVKEGK